MNRRNDGWYLLWGAGTIIGLLVAYMAAKEVKPEILLSLVAVLAIAAVVQLLLHWWLRNAPSDLALGGFTYSLATAVLFWLQPSWFGGVIFQTVAANVIGVLVYLIYPFVWELGVRILLMAIGGDDGGDSGGDADY